MSYVSPIWFLLNFLKKSKATWALCKELGPFGPLMLFAVIAPGLGAILLISSSNIWLTCLQELGTWSIPSFLILTILFTGLSLIPTHASSLIGGMLFGLIEGPIYALLGVVASSYFAFKLMSFAIKEKTYHVLLKRPRAAEIHAELLTKNGLKAILLIALVRLSPVMPFAGTNLLLAASKVKTSYFLLGSFIGLAPRVILVAIAGAGLAELDLSKSSNIWFAIIGGISTLFLIYFIGKVVKKVYHKSEKKSGQSEIG